MLMGAVEIDDRIESFSWMESKWNKKLENWNNSLIVSVECNLVWSFLKNFFRLKFS